MIDLSELHEDIMALSFESTTNQGSRNTIARKREDKYMEAQRSQLGNKVLERVSRMMQN